jgi:hypothetical protein
MSFKQVHILYVFIHFPGSSEIKNVYYRLQSELTRTILAAVCNDLIDLDVLKINRNYVP